MITTQKFKFVDENKGIGSKSGKPFHIVQVHDPLTYQNLTFSIDTNTVLAPFNFAPGQDVEVTGVKFEKLYDNTITKVTGLREVSNK